MIKNTKQVVLLTRFQNNHKDVGVVAQNAPVVPLWEDHSESSVS